MVLCWLCMTGLSMADNCYDCHSSWEDEDTSPSALFKTDVHYKAELGCSDCHGGDPNLDDMDEVRKSKGWKGVPGTLQIPEFCGSCHSDPTYMIKHNPSLPTDQLEKYRTSIHGKNLYGKKDKKVATCVSCHSVHNIQSHLMPGSSVYALNIPKTCAHCHADAEYMKSYGIPTDQYDDFVKSTHGKALLVNKDLGAPACNDCHGNHGATPPGVESISAVCGLCHSLVADKFASSPHQSGFEAMDIPQCEICHSNHLIVQPQLYWVGSSDSSLCVNCHSRDDGTIGLVTADSIHADISNLVAAYNRAELKVDSADSKGMMVTDERFMLKDVQQSIIKSKTELHTFNYDSVTAVAKPGIKKANAAFDGGVKLIEEYYFRRKGLGIATLLITILAIGLYLKIRSIEKK